MTDLSFLFNAHPSYIESMYEQYRKDPDSVDEGWKLFFRGFDFGGSKNGVAAGPQELPLEKLTAELNVLCLIKAYRNRGHLVSTTNPIRPRRDRKPHLKLEDFDLSEKDLDTHFFTGYELGMEGATLREIMARLESIYCANIGFEYNHIPKREQRRWLRTRIEQGDPRTSYGLSEEKKRRILEKLNGAVVFEKFLHTKYVGQKRFSLEGGETTIAALDAIIQAAAKDKVEEVVIAMAHRGRLNVLANIMGKTYEQIFNEFEGTAVPDLSFGDGDVKYHLGFSSQIEGPNGKTVYLKLAPNPSHLEAVNPVVEGFARAKADVLYHSEYDCILPILIHGDAAMAGQGVVYETVQLSTLKGYDSGGTIHFVINNQIGFTTDFDDARSSTYSTAAANMIQAPVFHVNGDDPEAVVFAAEMAVAYRQEFNSDVFIDMVCYRRHGHNEGDDPKFTQPAMYKIINSHPDSRQIYSQKLVQRGDVDKSLAEIMEKEFWNLLQARLDNAKQNPLPYQYQESEKAWRALKKKTTPEDFESSPATGVDRKVLDKILKHIHTIPKGFTPLDKINRLIKGSQKMVDDNKMDWALGELLAYGTILLEGRDVRLSGQDVKRGTFSHRHAIFRDADTNEEYSRLGKIADKQGVFRIFNSPLSEFAVLGFEYGYSLATPDTLVLWEAQFGDFHNGAQTIIDQFICAGESKWQRMSGLTMLLPHGYEGQGPEHSSARVERFLQLCAEYNMTVANCTTPANFFHLLRRQLVRPFRKPLVVMTPKSLLRHPEVVSPIEDFESGKAFREIIDDPDGANAKKIRRVLLCSGKVYFDLHERKHAESHHDVAIVRMEQLFPMPQAQLDAIRKKYANAEFFWVQEEPANMGAWEYILSSFYGTFDLRLVSRKASASPASGFKKVHDKQQRELVDRAFA
ncbi:MAG: 2-oxoglutarate dehydrogenase E1 component [Saprospirales bacterium]|nr:2-oxoglutarate dehydrogenase E1 component [Saprospirales bacterium]